MSIKVLQWKIILFLIAQLSEKVRSKGYAGYELTSEDSVQVL